MMQLGLKSDLAANKITGFWLRACTLFEKLMLMPRDDAGAPGGAHQEQHNTGKPGKIGVEDIAQNQKMTEKYTEADTDINENIRTNHPNRNDRLNNGISKIENFFD